MTPPSDDATTAASPTPPTDGATVAQTGAPPVLRAGEVPEVPGYELLGELGRGGMGVVYKARQISLNRVVALKMLPGASYAEAHERVRFLAEAELVAAVRHGHVVQVFDFGECGGRPYFAMEHLGGGSLVELIRKTGRLTPRT